MNQVRSDINQVQNTINTLIPSVYDEGFILNWAEVNIVVNSINSAFD
jgi:hypothetical protein